MVIRGTQAVGRAVTLLQAFSDQQPSWRLADLARATRLHKATAHRLLAALEQAGMVARDSGDQYRLGPEVIALGARAARATGLHGPGREALEALAAATGETATLEVPAGRDMLIVDEVPGRALVNVSAELGSRWPMHATSTGRAFLAAVPERARAALIGPRPARFTPRTVTALPALARELGRVRRLGYAVVAQELEPGYVAIGAAVLDAGGRPVAALSVGGPTARLPQTRYAALGREVRRAADRVSAALGWRASA